MYFFQAANASPLKPLGRVGFPKEIREFSAISFAFPSSPCRVARCVPSTTRRWAGFGLAPLVAILPIPNDQFGFLRFFGGHR